MKQYNFKINNKSYIYDDSKMIIFEADQYNNLSNYYVKNFNTKIFNSINLVTNQTCNMNCDYCYANGGTFGNKGKIMNFNIAKKAIDLLFESIKIKNYNIAKIGFIGGEPLLNFKLIEKTVNYVNEKYSNYVTKWSIITNFTLINDNIFKFLKNNNFKVIVSIDGNKEKHDLHRKYINGKGTFDDILKNIKIYGKDLNIKVRGTITNENYDVYNFVNEMLKYNVKNISFGYDAFLNEECYKKFKISYNKLINKYLLDIQNNIFYNIDNISNYILKLAVKTKKEFNCNSGISYRAISPNGDTYLCHRFVEQKKYMFKNIENLNIYSLYKEISEFDKLRKTSTNNIKCLKCSFKNLCGGTCYHNSFIISNNIFKINNLDCAIKKDFIISSIKMLVLMPEKLRKNYILEIIKIKNNERG